MLASSQSYHVLARHCLCHPPPVPIWNSFLLSPILVRSKKTSRSLAVLKRFWWEHYAVIHSFTVAKVMVALDVYHDTFFLKLYLSRCSPCQTPTKKEWITLDIWLWKLDRHFCGYSRKQVNGFCMHKVCAV